MPDQNPGSVSIIHDLVFHLIDLVFTIIIDKSISELIKIWPQHGVHAL